MRRREVDVPTVGDREGRVAAKLRHPNAIEVLDVGVEDGVPYLVMDLLHGTDLRALLADAAPLSPSHALAFLLPIASALRQWVSASAQSAWTPGAATAAGVVAGAGGSGEASDGGGRPTLVVISVSGGRAAGGWTLSLAGSTTGATRTSGRARFVGGASIAGTSTRCGGTLYPANRSTMRGLISFASVMSALPAAVSPLRGRARPRPRHFRRHRASDSCGAAATFAGDFSVSNRAHEARTAGTGTKAIRRAAQPRHAAFVPKPVDFDQLRTIVGDDRAFMNELCETFVQSSGRIVEELERALSAGDRVVLSAMAHKLKGGSSSICAHELAQMAATL